MLLRARCALAFFRTGRRSVYSFTPAFDVVEGRKEEGKEERTGVVLHGLMGNALNWQRTMKNFVSTPHPEYNLKCILVDLRHHGESVRMVNECAHCSHFYTDSATW
mgnify:CR=1 FL=1